MTNTNGRFVKDINRIVHTQQNKQSSFSDIQLEPIASTIGIGNKIEVENQASGIASPLKEIAHLREYYEPEFLTSSDGLFVMERKILKKMVFEDADGNNLYLIFSNII